MTVAFAFHTSILTFFWGSTKDMNNEKHLITKVWKENISPSMIAVQTGVNGFLPGIVDPDLLLIN